MNTDDPGLCPLCGHANLCQQAQAGAGQPFDCWCQHQHFADALLQQIPAAQRGKACICQRCAERAEQLSHPATNTQGATSR